MKNLTSIVLIFLISAFVPPILLSQSLKIKQVRIWDSEKRNFGPVSEIEVERSRIKSIRPSEKNGPVKFLLPGFCDATVHMSKNGLGGNTQPEDLSFHLRSYVSAGFSHILSIGDPDLSPLEREITKQKWQSPILIQAQRPLLYSDFSLENDNLYQNKMPVQMDPKRIGILPIFLKEKDDRGFNQNQLFAIRKDILFQNKTPIVYTFGDPTSWEDSLDTGHNVLFHPMPETAKLNKIQKRGFYWAPMISTLYLSELLESPDKKKQLVEVLIPLHSSFSERGKEPFLALSPEDPLDRKGIGFQEAFTVFQDRKDQVQLVFASGAGHLGLLPGTAAVVEILLWEEAMKPKKIPEGSGGSSEHWFFRTFIRPFQKNITLIQPNPDPETIPEYRREMIRSLTDTTCGLIGADHKGKIEVGGPAHFSILTENPLFRISGIFPIESMVVGGKLVYTPKPSPSR
ncbi:MAG: hypothetical protein O9301_15510 [Leptospira sp.]|nr:hypothetical protein [Leptospira sp.]